MSLITYLTRIHFADRVLEDALPGEVARLNLRSLLVVHDAAAGPGEALDRLLCALPSVCAVTLLNVSDSGDPAKAAALARQAGCDGVVGLGGRAALRLARRLPGSGGKLPVIAVPTTTACVGLAQTPPAPSRVDERARLPAAVLCDPTLTLQAGPAETAAAGMDALVHCLETYLATAWNPPADGIALEGVRRAGLWLVRTVEDGSNLEARRELLAVALNGALAGQKGLGAVHALAHALEHELDGTNPPHGTLHAALLPPALRFNAPAVGDRFAALAGTLGLPSGTDLAEALGELGARIGLPASLRGQALVTGALDRVASRAVEEAASRTNPRHATAADYRALLDQAW